MRDAKQASSSQAPPPLRVTLQTFRLFEDMTGLCLFDLAEKPTSEVTAALLAPGRLEALLVAAAISAGHRRPARRLLAHVKATGLPVMLAGVAEQMQHFFPIISPPGAADAGSMRPWTWADVHRLLGACGCHALDLTLRELCWRAQGASGRPLPGVCQARDAPRCGAVTLTHAQFTKEISRHV